MGPRNRVARAFAGRLLAWYDQTARDLPWRRSTDPYRVWVSEIMLQQTRAQAAIPFYERFLARFPTVAALAQAGEDDVLAAWSGLGYYSRARNLQRAATAVHRAGAFPPDFDGWRALPGVGEYTAAAVCSIAFNMPRAAVDGNLLRVFARLDNDPSDVRTPATRRRVRERVEELMSRARAGDFNQALMDLGATVCLPADPRCPECPVARFCSGRKAGTARSLPAKGVRPGPVRLEETLLLVRRRGRVLLRRESGGARRLAGFWQLPWAEHLPGAVHVRLHGSFRHTITKYHYTFAVVEAELDAVAPDPACAWFRPGELKALPLAAAARKALALAGVIPPPTRLQ